MNRSPEPQRRFRRFRVCADEPQANAWFLFSGVHADEPPDGTLEAVMHHMPFPRARMNHNHG